MKAPFPSSPASRGPTGAAEGKVSAARRATVNAARAAWIERLLDASRRNPLLFYRELPAGTLELSVGAQAALDELVRGNAVLLRSLVWQPGTEPVHRAKISVKIREISRRASESREERGLSTPCLAAGRVTWPAADGGPPHDAPLLLVPVRIDGDGRNSRRVVLRRAGRVVVNPLLDRVLFAGHGVPVRQGSLLALERDEAQQFAGGLPIASLLDAARAATAGVAGLVVAERWVLGNFPLFATEAAREIEENGDAFAAHPLVAALAGDGPARAAAASAARAHAPHVRDLDRVPPENEHLFLDADAAQQLVVAGAIDGRDGVVQGPPGTGKGQTVANLVAETAARGISVLLVTGTRTAADSVLGKLRESGLSQLVLDLHGDGAEAQALPALGRSLRAASALPAPPPEKDDGLLARFFHVRQRLAAHAARINLPRSPSGLSIHQLQAKLLRSADGPRSSVRWTGAVLEGLTPERIAVAKELLVEAGGTRELFFRDPSTSPWALSRLETDSAAQEAWDRATRLAGRTLPELRKAAATLARDLNFEIAESPAELRAQLTVLSLVGQVLDSWDVRVFREDLPLLVSGLQLSAQGSPGPVAWLLGSAPDEGVAQARALRRDPAGKTASPDELLRGLRHVMAVRERWQALSGPRSVPSLPRSAQEASRALTGATAELGPLSAAVGSGDLGALSFAELAKRLDLLAGDGATPSLVPRLVAIERDLAALGLSLLVEEIRRVRAEAPTWPLLLRDAWLASCLEKALAEEPELASFSGRDHDRLVEEFRTLDVRRLGAAAARVKRQQAGRAAAALAAEPGEAALVREATASAGPGREVRSLVEAAPTVVRALRTCWLTSPHSVSRLLPPAAGLFDLVVFDGADQLRPEEGAAALIRGRHVIALGDRHQPPLARPDAAGEEEEPAASQPSLLDVLSGFLPAWILDGHTRSRDESLVAFSNRYVYGNRLVTLPGVSLERVVLHDFVPGVAGPEADVDSAPSEVSRVVQLVLDHAWRRPAETLGVVTMGARHASRIRSALDKALSSRPEVASFFDARPSERFFVKDASMVSGEERDAVILAFGWGPDASGRLTYRFGALPFKGGERTLNAALGRARRRLTLVSSFRHTDLDEARCATRGLHLLRSLLEYAALGGLPEGAGSELSPSGQALLPAAPDEFDSEVAEALSARGVPVRSPHGISRGRLALAAGHPADPARLVLALESDGPAYFALPTVRERDRLRRQRLEALGWKFHRVWSAAWYRDPGGEADRAFAAWEQAVRASDRERSASLRVSFSGEWKAPRVPVLDSYLAPAPAALAAQRPGPPRPVRVGEKPRLPVGLPVERYREDELRSLRDWIRSDGRSYSAAEMIDEILSHLGVEERTLRAVEILSAIVADAP